jgi:hypothetical protein
MTPRRKSNEMSVSQPHQKALCNNAAIIHCQVDKAVVNFCSSHHAQT